MSTMFDFNLFNTKKRREKKKEIERYKVFIATPFQYADFNDNKKKKYFGSFWAKKQNHCKQRRNHRFR